MEYKVNDKLVPFQHSFLYTATHNLRSWIEERYPTARIQREKFEYGIYICNWRLVPGQSKHVAISVEFETNDEMFMEVGDNRRAFEIYLNSRGVRMTPKHPAVREMTYPADLKTAITLAFDSIE